MSKHSRPSSINSPDFQGITHNGPYDAKKFANVNFSKLLLCSISFLGMYIALYSAQNVQAVMFMQDGYESLGFYSNAFAYAG
jgi:hypothetical protein